MSNVADRAKNLRDDLNEHIYRYHVLNDPIITDAEYDQLYHELVQIEADHPDLRTPDSPTQRVGSDLDSDFPKVEHPAPILSLSNAFTPEDLRAWETRNRKRLPDKITLDYVLQPKLDGLSIVITYEDGVLRRAATRGNGEMGDDVTANIRTVNTVPLRIPANPESDQAPPQRLVVRGEVLFLKQDFDVLNREQEARGLTRFVNARNAASGSLKQKDSRITAERPLPPFIYNIVASEGVSLATEQDVLHYLQTMGFHTVPQATHYDDLERVIARLDAWEEQRDALAFEIDGLVIKINDLALQRELGVVGKDPRGMTAYKFPAEEATTTLQGVTINIGRTGKVTPTAQLDPVYIGGVTVSNASLHNYDLIEQLDVRRYDRVVIKRSGDVIPYVIGPVLGARTGDEAAITPPTTCPFCATELVRPRGAVDLFCPNPTCPERVFRSLEFFVSRGAMDIDGMGPQTIQALIDADLVQDEADIFYLQADPIEALEGFGEKKVENLLTAIDKAKGRPLTQLIASLGIEGVGMTVAGFLTERFHTMDDLLALSSQVKQAEADFVALIQPFARTESQLEGQLPDVKQARLRLLNPLVELAPRYIDSADVEKKLARLLKPILEIAPADAPTPADMAEKLDALMTAVKPLMSIEGIGAIIVRNIVDWFADEHHQAILAKMRRAGVNMQAEEQTQASTALDGLKFVLTGSMSVTRDAIKDLIETHGGKVTSSVSKKTDYVVVGATPGSKADKADKLGVPIISEDDLRAML